MIKKRPTVEPLISLVGSVGNVAQSKKSPENFQ